MSKRFAIFVSIFLALSCSQVLANGSSPGTAYESHILQTIEEIRNLDLDEAITRSQELISQYPNSRLGQLMYADLMLAKTQPLLNVGSGLLQEKASRDFHHELQQRWSHQDSPAHQGMLPENVLHLADRYPFVILVDQKNSRTYVYRNHRGRLILEYDYFTTIGLKGYGKQVRGDQKTPIGVYHVNRYIDGEELPDLYGEGAFPINYPNVWDQRNERTGYGIWIHGTPSDTFNRSPWASDGCIVVSNPDFAHMEQYIDPRVKTPIVVTETINWIHAETWESRRQNMLRTLSQWVSDWESLDHNAYRAHYSQSEFSAYGRDFKSWDGHKRWVNRQKTRVDVDFEHLNMFVYPGEEDLVLMQFDQQYRSNNLDVDASKEIYWRLNEERWQIVYEGIRYFPEDDTRVAEGQEITATN